MMPQYRPLPNRRAVLRVFGGVAAAAQMGCSSPTQDVRARVLELEAGGDLILFRTDRHETVESGRRPLNMPLGDTFSGMRVSPDCRSIAGAPKLTFEESGLIKKADGDDTLLLVKAAREPAVPIVFPRSVALAFGLSDSGECVVWTSTVGSQSPRLLMFKLNTSGGARDLSGLLLHDPLTDIVRISVSGVGQYVAVSSSDEFSVFDLQAKALLLRGSGHSASLSPTGDRVAFVDSGLGLVIHDLRRRRAARIMPWTRVAGIGGWSPDGRYLLAGAFTSLSRSKRLIALDIPTGHYADLAALKEGDDGSYCTWILRELLR